MILVNDKRQQRPGSFSLSLYWDGVDRLYRWRRWRRVGRQYSQMKLAFGCTALGLDSDTNSLSLCVCWVNEARGTQHPLAEHTSTNKQSTGIHGCCDTNSKLLLLPLPIIILSKRQNHILEHSYTTQRRKPRFKSNPSTIHKVQLERTLDTVQQFTTELDKLL